MRAGRALETLLESSRVCERAHRAGETFGEESVIVNLGGFAAAGIVLTDRAVEALIDRVGTLLDAVRPRGTVHALGGSVDVRERPGGARPARRGAQRVAKITSRARRALPRLFRRQLLTVRSRRARLARGVTLALTVRPHRARPAERGPRRLRVRPSRARVARRGSAPGSEGAAGARQAVVPRPRRGSGEVRGRRARHARDLTGQFLVRPGPARLAFRGARRVGEGSRGARHALLRARRAAKADEGPRRTIHALLRPGRVRVVTRIARRAPTRPGRGRRLTPGAGCALQG
mmetsp:Transcript_11441/g.44441  ORF Transcript_11441/g.44441 Transcript_11441/m.44441 type:complete len:290 (-) Transcript_11441:1062-1931(-)